MKLRPKWYAPLLAAPLGVLAVAPIPLVEPGTGYDQAGFWILAGIASGCVALIGLALLPFAIVRVEERELWVRGKYGWSRQVELAEGERWVAADGKLLARGADGTLNERRSVRRWTVRGADWARLEAAYGEDR
ncbi:hypothetical protein ACFQS3_21750 [Glycomyces mayteni]|uniref:PH domain-containing protein n=1 Tax=Glycomyces mayteni TaxID=543887 RepID=A0ABW2DFD0_9ACTN